MAKKLVAVMNTGFRDGFQSVFGARVITKDFLPAVEAAREAGFTHFEAGGGARYQALYFYSNEDAFDMMDAFRKAAGPDANLQTLARGVNVVGLDSQSSDIIELHAKMFKKHGMTTIRNFDALNDVRNLSYSGRCIAKHGLKHEVVVAMMALPPGLSGAHDPEFYMRTLEAILKDEVPFTSVCFKDASGTSVPSVMYDTIKMARRRLPEGTHIQVHTHETAGTSVATYRAALDAGADGIDLSMAPVSGGTCQPDVATMWHALRGTDYDLGVDIDKVLEAEEVFKDCMKDYFMPPESRTVEPLIPFSPMPGGALTANTQMMRDNDILDRYPEVIKAMTEVVSRGGFATSVTPVSQFYFQQAFNNVMFGPWKKMAEGYGKMLLGYFGKTPVPPDPELVKIAAEQMKLEPTTEDPRAINDRDPKKGIAPAKALLEKEGLPISDETIFIAAACKQKGIDFLKGKAEVNVRKVKKEEPKAEAAAGPAPDHYTVKVAGRTFDVKLDGAQALVDGQKYPFEVDVAGAAPAAGAAAANGTPVKTEMPGKVLKVAVNAGDKVASGDLLMVIEALKMEIEIKSPSAGTISQVVVNAGQQIQKGDTLVTIS